VNPRNICYEDKPSFEEKNTVGLRPKWVWEAKRIGEIAEAIGRYIEAGKDIPMEWIEEYNELTRRVNK
jgi:hypothetical protein